MGILRKGICKECGDGKQKLLAKPSMGLCHYHNEQRLQATRKPTKAYRYKRKPTGEAEMFRQIWEVRRHICEHCGWLLGNEAQPWFFSHIKSKGAYPELRLDPANIQLLCRECHRLYDQGTKAEYEARKLMSLNTSNIEKK